MKALDKEGEGFKYLHSVFSSLSEAKIKEGIFVGPDIRKLMSDEKFDEKLNNIELQAWLSFKEVVTKFLGNNKSSDYKEIVAKMISNLGVMGCNMSIKLHFLNLILQACGISKSYLYHLIEDTRCLLLFLHKTYAFHYPQFMSSLRRLFFTDFLVAFLSIYSRLLIIIFNMLTRDFDFKNIFNDQYKLILN